MEYLICTKTASSEKTNPIIGFSLYHEPSSVISLLSDGNLVTFGVLYETCLPELEELTIVDDPDANSPLKRVIVKLFIFRFKAFYDFN